ncbi:cyclopropane fatty acyl phospholipid synthase [Candidatus Nitronereus thalassa]|uniref:Cyclopropane fatty acyl phospholipid synthase n=1 Tax=Candidatus Nitronereus thalassa TaxID=3020898 RepID=A0ABU3K8R2_9BACT|nr:cyclopropane fatty acyl phospholipid synthase [Candidatus Nitronereus thalassa]MDT7042781.1 cyclopropane fatty acyl phospholipid synthase [Candidatus Nitronereus thalassa]
MESSSLRRVIERLLSPADIKINGDRPWDLQVHNEKLYARVLAHASLGLGESYMDGWWDCDRLDECVCRILRAELDGKIHPRWDLFHLWRAKLFNLQKPSRAYEIGRHHYDIGNDLYQCMLDQRMIYSCGYWPHAATLDAAQEAKLDLVCQKLDLQPGMRVLDIGCGWGGAARFAAERYGVEVVGITVSHEQAQYARKLCRDLPVEIRLQDYRKAEGMFDRIFSLGMIEHVGHKNYSTFMHVVRGHLREDGLLLLHTIGNNRSVTSTDPWIARYIFPNSMIPSAKQLASAFEGVFVLEDWQNFGYDYDNTLMQWYMNFDENWPALKWKYDDRFYRMWTFYLLSCAGVFRARKNQVWQLVLSPTGVKGGWCRGRNQTQLEHGLYSPAKEETRCVPGVFEDVCRIS